MKAFQTFRVGQKSNLLVTAAAAATEAVVVLSGQANCIESHYFQIKKINVKDFVLMITAMSF